MIFKVAESCCPLAGFQHTCCRHNYCIRQICHFFMSQRVDFGIPLVEQLQDHGSPLKREGFDRHPPHWSISDSCTWHLCYWRNATVPLACAPKFLLICPCGRCNFAISVILPGINCAQGGPFWSPEAIVKRFVFFQLKSDFASSVSQDRLQPVVGVLGDP